MKAQDRATVKELSFPVDGYRYDVQIITSVDVGKTWWHCGSGKYFRTLDEANAFAAEINGGENA